MTYHVEAKEAKQKINENIKKSPLRGNQNNGITFQPLKENDPKLQQPQPIMKRIIIHVNY